MKNLLFENIKHLIIKDFWMVKNWPYFHMSIWSCNFCLFLNFFVPQTNVFESFTWVIIHMDFVVFPFRISKLKNDSS
jgi:hypothetical protein